jgi:hypothetical protein
MLERPQEKSKSGSIGDVFAGEVCVDVLLSVGARADADCRRMTLDFGDEPSPDHLLATRLNTSQSNNSIYLIHHVSPETMGYSTVLVIVRPVIYKDRSKTRSRLRDHQSCSSIHGLSQSHFDPCDLERQLARSHQSDAVVAKRVLTIHERLLDLFFRCHHKRPMLHDWLVKWLSSDLSTNILVSEPR